MNVDASTISSLIWLSPSSPRSLPPATCKPASSRDRRVHIHSFIRCSFIHSFTSFLSCHAIGIHFPSPAPAHRTHQPALVALTRPRPNQTKPNQIESTLSFQIGPSLITLSDSIVAGRNI